MSPLVFRERPAGEEPLGLLVLHHGRGSDEHDLLSLGDALDPQRRLHVVTPRAPLSVTGWPGHHWYLVPRVGFPDPAATVLGGFSMGSVMSYALGLGDGRPAPAGILAFSGFVPTVEGWKADLPSREGLRAFIAHGRRDPVIDVEFARAARDLLRGAGLEVSYQESEVGHSIDPAHVPLASGWLQSMFAPGPPA
jgi:phospholipase/carboxylesterase